MIVFLRLIFISLFIKCTEVKRLFVCACVLDSTDQMQLFVFGIFL